MSSLVMDLTIFLFFSIVLSLKKDLVYSASQISHVTCGSVVKLVNDKYRVRLHSHDIKYGSGSGQQSVTGTDERGDHNSYWSIKGKPEEPCKRGEPVKCGSFIRMEHISTKKNLHSHLFKSPISGNQEVSAFGDKGEGDTGDYWTVVCNDETWKHSNPIRLKHVDTEMWLSVSGRTYNRPISGQLEVVATSYPDPSSYWTTQEGVYIKSDESTKISDHDEL